MNLPENLSDTRRLRIEDSFTGSLNIHKEFKKRDSKSKKEKKKKREKGV